MGGKFFKDENGNSICHRIPTNDVSQIVENVVNTDLLLKTFVIL
jgi:hypothetical protein